MLGGPAGVPDHRDTFGFFGIGGDAPSANMTPFLDKYFPPKPKGERTMSTRGCRRLVPSGSQALRLYAIAVGITAAATVFYCCAFRCA